MGRLQRPSVFRSIDSLPSTESINDLFKSGNGEERRFFFPGLPGSYPQVRQKLEELIQQVKEISRDARAGPE